MKRDIATFIACCDSCQRIKAEHQRPAGLLQPNKIPEWKWDEIGMDLLSDYLGHDTGMMPYGSSLTG